jgi:hypothetical protein
VGLTVTAVPQRLLQSVAPGRLKVGVEVVFKEHYGYFRGEAMSEGNVFKNERGVVESISRVGCTVRLVCASRFRRKLSNSKCEHHEKRALSMRGLVLGKLGLTEDERGVVEVVEEKSYMKHHC